MKFHQFLSKVVTSYPKMFTCGYCNNKFKTKYSLKAHTKSASYCLKLRGEKIDCGFVCTVCDKLFTSKRWLDSHIKKCGKDIMSVLEENRVLKMENKNKDKLLEKYEQKIKELQDKLENIALKAVEYYSFEEEAVIEIDPNDTSESDSDKDQDEPYELQPLEVGEGYTIEHRDEDGYINVTNLCKAGKKKFNDWYRLKRTKAFLKVLKSRVGITIFENSSTGIPSVELIQIGVGHKNPGDGNSHIQKNQQTWVHPQVAINIAQWISPQFDVKVSEWVYEIMMTGKVDITQTKSYRQLQQENKEKQLRIKLLERRYLKKAPRDQIKEKNVIYILTTKHLKKERRYILGKATDLTNRLSTYNKTDEHQIVYYQECPNTEKMGIVETLVFSKLDDYRERANRERFILPDDKEISFFINTVKECVSFVS